MLRITDRHERDMLYGPTNEEMITEIFRAYVRSYKDLPLNLYHIQWKFRDEVRPRFGVMRSREFLMKDAYSFDLDQAGARAFLQPDVRRLSAHLRAPGPEGDPDAGRYRPDRRRSQPRVHHPGLDRRERGVLPRGLSRLRRSRRPTPISTTWPGLQAIVDKWTSLYAATSEMHDAGGLRGACPAGQADVGPRHRGRPHLLLRHQVFRRRWARRSWARTARSTTSIWAPTASARRAWSPRIIEASHDDNGIIWPDAVAPFDVGAAQPEGRRRRRPTRPASSSIATLEAAGRRRALRRPRRAAGREVRHRGPDRHAVAGDRRPEGPGRGQGRDEAPRDRRARSRCRSASVVAAPDRAS